MLLLSARWTCGGYPTGPPPNASADTCRGCHLLASAVHPDMWAMTIRQSGAYRHLKGHVNGLLAESGQN